MPTPRNLPTPRFVARLFIAYCLDWVVVLATIAFAASTSIWVTPNTRPFSVTDPSISFPFQHNAKISSSLLIVLSVIVPAALILFLTILLPTGESSVYSLRGWKRRIYCLNAAWLGLALSLAIAMLVTNGLKNLIGRPRPDLLSRCDVDTEQIKTWTIGANGLLDWRVCRSKSGAASLRGALDEADVRDGFRSFPSGHSSMSFAGLTYLAIFMAEFVFSLPVPHLSKVAAPIVGEPAMSAPRRRSKAHYEDPETPLPRFPIMGVILLCGIPVLLAIYISSTRFSDYRHHTFDILSGSLLGLFSGVVGWRWYGSWCCAGGDGRVYGLVKRERDRKKRDTEVVEKGATVAEEEQPHPAARRTSGEFGMAV